MIDRYILPIQKRLLQPLANRLVEHGVSANMITITGFVIGMTALPLLALQQYVLALVVILVNRFHDGLDGAVARSTSPTDRGAFMDIALDFFFYATVPLGFAIADPQANALAAATLITAFVGTGSSFLAFSVMAGKRGLAAQDYPQKGIYYLGGLTEGAETIAFFAVMCLLPGRFAELAYVFAALCLLTTVTRWVQGWQTFKTSDDPSAMADHTANEKP
ncbi:CDP-alcohol phosphatidyltransferase family protein [Rhizobium sp. L1K21]|uniref:CDP-alcohol phosphatidyltransferase family protein n=1 Tax=Rhizobium sp. L1K21 TaxID=2954933 RepID=UPI0020925688|nr:CDP-alcohol phosphatidyltransferase family protein [Rhizobium sp. L1K21]MCO6184752.1 CDP-alcohol phosphatidyltransferase family protein [Rhizobium sp. L1K21]